LLRPGPQPCNNIPPTYQEAVARLLELRRARPAGRGLRRYVRRLLAAHVDSVLESLIELAARLDRVERRLGEKYP
jgi:hypothetical protein